MKQTQLLWDMPISIEITDPWSTEEDITAIYDYFKHIDAVFSIFRSDSEISKINRHELQKDKYSGEMREVLELCQQTKTETNGYFDIKLNEKLNPLGLVKGWALFQAYLKLKDRGYHNFYLEAGGDIQTAGKNSGGSDWVIGIRNPFNRKENVKIVRLSGQGIATSGTYIRGQHIYNPHTLDLIDNPVSLTVIGPNIYQADRFATAAFAMGMEGINFIASKDGLEGYMIDLNGLATFTPGFEKFILTP